VDLVKTTSTDLIPGSATVLPQGSPEAGRGEEVTQLGSLLQPSSTHQPVIASEVKKESSLLPSVAVIEAFAGVGAFLRSFSIQGASVLGHIEWDTMASDLLKAWWPHSFSSGDFYAKDWLNWPSADVMVAGFECTPYSLSGKELGSRDHRSSQLADLADLAKAVSAKHFLGENVPQLLKHPTILEDGDKAFSEVDISRLGTLRLTHNKCGGASIRDRIFLYYEHNDVTALLPKFVLPRVSEVPSGQISSHLVPFEEVPEHCYLAGKLDLRKDAHGNANLPLLMGRLLWNDATVQRGSLLKLKATPGRWRVMEDIMSQDGALTFEVMRSDLKGFHPKRWITQSSIEERISQNLPFFSINHPSKAIRAWGEYPIRTAQLVLVPLPDDTGFKVRALLAQEVWSIQELSRKQLEDACKYMGVHLPDRGTYIPISGWREAAIYRLAGNTIPQSMLKLPTQLVMGRVMDSEVIMGSGRMGPAGMTPEQIHCKALKRSMDPSLRGNRVEWKKSLQAVVDTIPGRYRNQPQQPNDASKSSLDKQSRRALGLAEVIEKDEDVLRPLAQTASSATKERAQTGHGQSLIEIRIHLVVLSRLPELGVSKLLPFSVPLSAATTKGDSPFCIVTETVKSLPSMTESLEVAKKWLKVKIPELAHLSEHIYHAGNFPTSQDIAEPRMIRSLDRALVILCSQRELSGRAWRSVKDLTRHQDISIALAAMCAASRHSDLSTVSKVSIGIDELMAKDERLCKAVTGATEAAQVESRRMGEETVRADYDARVAQMARSATELEKQLLEAEDDEWAPASYLRAWVPAIGHPPLEAIPHTMRKDLTTFKDPTLVTLPFPDTSRPASTLWCNSDPEQLPVLDFQPTRIEDILMSEALLLLSAWIRRSVQDLLAYRDHGPNATRKNNKPLAIGQDLFQPQARGKIWDLREWTPGEVIPLLRYDAEVNTKFNKYFLTEELKNFPDQELLSFMTAGVIFKADLELQLVFLPHLMSLANGFHSVEDELKRLEKDGHYAFFKNIPFLPCRCQPQGSVPRVLEDRWRRILEGGGPRKETFDTGGRIVVPLNEASKLNSGEEYVSKEKRQKRAFQGKSPKWPRELKPKVADVMVSAMILGHAASLDDEPVFAFQDDASDWFHQFFLSSQEYWKVCVLYLNLMEDKDSPQIYMYAVEYCLAMGLFQASNIAQRAANMIVDTFLKYARISDEKHKNSLTSAQRTWLDERKLISSRLQQDRLHDASMYTDDSNICVVGVSRTIRMIRVWYFVITSMNLKMAHARKRHVGTGVKFLGAFMYFALGLLVFPEHKVVMALAMLRMAIMGTITQGEYRKLLGLLEHFLVLARGSRGIMHGVYAPLGDANLNSADCILPSQWIIEKMGEWRKLLLQTSGCPFFFALPSISIPRTPYSKVFYLFGDAARSSEEAGIGGYFHGHWWTHALSKAQLALQIPHLEFIALVINIALFVRLVLMEHDDLPENVEILANADGLAGVLNLTKDKGKSEVMWYIQEYFKNTSEYKRVKHNLKLAHLFGLGNPLGDAASRGYITLLKAMCLEMGIKPMHLNLPTDLKIFLLQSLAMAKLATYSQAHKAVIQTASRNKVIKREREELDSELSSRQVRAQNEMAPTLKPINIRLLDETEKALTISFVGGNKNSAEQPKFIANFKGNRALTPVKILIEKPSQSVIHLSTKASPTFISDFKHKGISSVQVDSSSLPRTQPVKSRKCLSYGSKSGYEPAVYNRLVSKDAEMTVGASQLLKAMQQDNHPQAPKPADWAKVEQLCVGLATATTNSGAASTNALDLSVWTKYWVPFTTENNIPEWLTEPVNTAEDRKRESLILGLFFIHVAGLIRPRSKSSKEAKPDSIKQVLQSIKRRHKRKGITFSPGAGSLAATAMNGMKHLYVKIHGPEALMPNRKEPFCDGLDKRLIELCQTSVDVGKLQITPTLTKWKLLSTMLKTVVSAGFRKAELCGEFTKGSLSRQHLTWSIAACGSQPILSPTNAQIAQLQLGDYAMLRPPVMKNDQFGERYMSFPIYLSWDSSDKCNSAVALAALEAEFPVSAKDRINVPLFFESCDQGTTTPFSATSLDATLRLMLTHLVGTEQASKHSWHSFRITLACSLFAAGYSEGVIQRMCRWKSVESCKAYARLDAKAYMSTLAAASRVRLQQTQTSCLIHDIPQIDADAQWQAIDANLPHLRRLQED